MEGGGSGGVIGFVREPVVRGVALASLLAVIAVAVVGAAASALEVPYETFTREPQVVLDGEAYVGTLSNLGALVWSLSAVSAALAASVLIGRQRRLFASVAVLTAAMLADDLFLLHDAVYPQIGLSETKVQALYFLAIAVIVAVFRAEIGVIAILGIAAGMGFWALSAFMDRFLNESALNLDQLVEDGAKFVGIAIWSAVWIVLAHGGLRRASR